MAETTTLRGRLVVDDDVVAGVIEVREGAIAAIEPDAAAADGPLIAPGFIDVHVHGYGGHDAMGGPGALDGMARALLQRGVTSFLPSAVTAPLDALDRFADAVRSWRPNAPSDGAEPLGFNLEGPFLAPSRRGAHPAQLLRAPADVDAAAIDGLIDGLRLITIAPELPGSLDLIERLTAAGVPVSLGHSAADVAEARAGYAAGATTTTHLFNAMGGLAHRDPGLALVALLDDDVWTELIADGHHVDRGLWPLISRLKPADKVILVSDAIPIAGTDATSGRLGSLEVVVSDGRATVAGTDSLGGSLIALDTAVRELVGNGTTVPDAIRAASTNPAALLGVDDRGAIAPGRRADLVELDDDLRVVGVMRSGSWIGG